MATTVVLGSGQSPISLPLKRYPDIQSHPKDIYSHPKDIYSYPKASLEHLHSIFKTSQKEKNEERKGCTSITETFRKAIFSRWPMPKSHEGIKQSLSDDSAIT